MSLGLLTVYQQMCILFDCRTSVCSIVCTRSKILMMYVVCMYFSTNIENLQKKIIDHSMYVLLCIF